MAYIADHFFIAGLPEDYVFPHDPGLSVCKCDQAVLQHHETIRRTKRLSIKTLEERPNTAEQRHVLCQIITRLDDGFELRPLDMPVGPVQMGDYDDGDEALRLLAGDQSCRCGASSETASKKKESKARRPLGYAHCIPDIDATDLPEGIHPRTFIPAVTPANANHLVRRRFPPQLLSRYPEQPEAHRLLFPDYLPMFAFPDDIGIKLADERPPATWHSFSMTQASSERIHGTCLILWTPLPRDAAQTLEEHCEAWQQAHLSPEDKELAQSLSARLASARTQLSQLLLQLNETSFLARDALAEQIEACEEKIALYTSLVRPLRHAASAEIDGLTQGAGYWMPRAYGLLGRDAAHQRTWRDWLLATCAAYFPNELQGVYPGEPLLPLERHVVQFLSETPAPPSGRVRVSIPVRSITLTAIKEPPNEIPGSRRVDLYPLFRALSQDNIIKLWTAALLECRILFVSTHLSMLSLATHGLLSLLYPFDWQGVFIPVLPKRLLQGLDAPTPYIMGIAAEWAPDEWPVGSDVVVCHLDSNHVEGHVPPLPTRLGGKLASVLSQACVMHALHQVPYGPPPYCQTAYPSDSVVFGPGQVQTSGPSLLNTLLIHGRLSTEDEQRQTRSPPKLNAFAVDASSSNEQQHIPTRVKSSGRSISDLLSQAEVTRQRLQRSAFPSISLRRDSLASSGELLQLQSMRAPSQVSLSQLAQQFDRGTYGPMPPSTSYATSTLMSFMPSLEPKQPSQTTLLTMVLHREGHQMRQMQSETQAEALHCAYTLEPIEGAAFRCLNCDLTVAAKHVDQITLPCLPTVLDTDRVRAAFARAFATLMRDYRSFLRPSVFDRRTSTDRKTVFTFDQEAFLIHTANTLGCGRDPESFLERFAGTMLFASFMETRRRVPAGAPEIKLFDEMIAAKVKRSRAGFFAGRPDPTGLRSSAWAYRQVFYAPRPNSRDLPEPWHAEASILPATLQAHLFSEPRTGHI